MNSWVPKTKMIIIVSILFVFSVVVYGVAFFATKGKVNSIRLAYSNTASTIALEEEARKTKGTLEENANNIDTINKYFVSKGDEVTFIEDIESLAKKSGIKFDIVSISPVKPQSEDVESKEISVKMNTEGAWSKTLLFLDGLEKLPFGVSIQNFNFDKPTGSSWKGSIEFLVFN